MNLIQTLKNKAPQNKTLAYHPFNVGEWILLYFLVPYNSQKLVFLEVNKYITQQSQYNNILTSLLEFNNFCSSATNFVLLVTPQIGK